MSGYPPGVTGNEWQISGPEYEADEFKECRYDGVQVRVISPTGRLLIKQLNEMTDEDEFSPVWRGLMRQRLRSLEQEIEVVDMAVCPFEGDVTVQGHGGMKWWMCPLCQMEHEEEMFGPDE